MNNYELKTIANDEQYLRQKSVPVKFPDPMLQEEIAALESYCLNNDVLAMASIQIGIPKRIIYLKNTNLDIVNEYQENPDKKLDNSYNEARILINPVITKKIGLTEYWEACASCLNNMGHVLRPYRMEIKYQDIKGKKHQEMFTGFESTVLSHEIDHLDGILHMDIALEVLEMAERDRRIFRQTHNYNIISKTSDYEKLKLRFNSR